MRLTTLTLAALLPCATAAAEEPTVVASHNGWVVRSAGNWCDALNRDPQEFDAAPYNALAFGRSGGSQRIVMRVYFWPGAFEDDKPVTLRVEPKGTAPLVYTAMTTGDSIVDIDNEVSKRDMDKMIGAGWIVVKASDVEPTLAFNTSALAVPLADLEKCAAGLKGG